jgi:hypothetical protein
MRADPVLSHPFQQGGSRVGAVLARASSRITQEALSVTQRALSVTQRALSVTHESQVTFFLSANESTKEALLVLRGTQNLQDVLTDVNALAQGFVGAGGDGELVSGFSHQGMAAAAQWLAHEVAPCLAALHFNGYRITLVRAHITST